MKLPETKFISGLFVLIAVSLFLLSSRISSAQNAQIPSSTFNVFAEADGYLPYQETQNFSAPGSASATVTDLGGTSSASSYLDIYGLNPTQPLLETSLGASASATTANSPLYNSPQGESSASVIFYFEVAGPTGVGVPLISSSNAGGSASGNLDTAALEEFRFRFTTKVAFHSLI